MQEIEALPRIRASSRVARSIARALIAGSLAALGLELFYSSRFGRFSFQGGPSIAFGLIAAGFAIWLGGARDRPRRRRVYAYALFLSILAAVLIRLSLVARTDFGPIAWLATCLCMCLLAAGIASCFWRYPDQVASARSSRRAWSRCFAALIWLSLLGASAVYLIAYTGQDEEKHLLLSLGMFPILHLSVPFLAIWLVLVQDPRVPVGFSRYAALLLYPFVALAFGHAIPLAPWWEWAV